MDGEMPSYRIKIQCEQGHNLYSACYRATDPKPKTGRIEGVLYCPECDDFYQMKSEKIKVTFK